MLPGFHLQSAIDVLRGGGVIAYPTEGVYGLGCDPDSESAVEALLAIKGRPVSKGLLLIGSDLDQLLPWLDLNRTDRQRLEVWPEGTSYLIRASSRVPAWIRGSHVTLGVRLTRHALAAELCRAFGGPLVSTSANLSGRPPARNRFQVMRQLGDQLDFVVAGDCGGRGRPSTIIDFASGEVVRA